MSKSTDAPVLQFDLCDEDRHFQLVVPVLARQHPHLLDAIFAVAARHLSRLPQYKTGPRGAILYHGQALPHLDEHAAVEYMLRCIPALRQFDDARAADADYRDSIIATAVILRQLEEIDHEADDGGASGGGDGGGGGGAREHQQRQQRQRPVNFLAIIDAVLRSLPSRDAFRQRSVMQAAYWMALRQEIFNSFTRREAPQLMLPAEFWHSASRANKVVMHLVQCAKWHWGDGSDHEWSAFSSSSYPWTIRDRKTVANKRNSAVDEAAGAARARHLARVPAPMSKVGRQDQGRNLPHHLVWEQH